MPKETMKDLLRRTLMSFCDEEAIALMRAAIDVKDHEYRPVYGCRADTIILLQAIDRLKEEVAFLKSRPVTE